MSGVKDSHRTLTELVGAARDAFGDDLTAREQAGLVRFEQAVARRTLRGTARAGAWALGFGVVAAGAAAALVMFQRADTTLTFAVVNGNVSDGGYVRAKASGGTELRFSDGSSLALDPGTSTRVTDIDAHGSRVLLESGRAHVRVTHRKAAKWVDRRGAVFGPRRRHRVRRALVGRRRGAGRADAPGRGDRARATGERRPHHGGGPASGRERQGGRDLPGREPGVRSRQPAARRGRNRPSPRSSDPGTPAVAPVAPAGAGPSHAMRARPGAGRADAGGGDGRELEQADGAGRLPERARGRRAARPRPHAGDGVRRGSDRAGGRGPLRAAGRRRPADATWRSASGSPVRSRRARRRSSWAAWRRTNRASAAAKTALEWYERYMSDSPRGTYAAQALGRQMILVHKLRGADAARPIASDYLTRFPSGPYADVGPQAAARVAAPERAETASDATAPGRSGQFP